MYLDKEYTELIEKSLINQINRHLVKNGPFSDEIAVFTTGFDGGRQSGKTRAIGQYLQKQSFAIYVGANMHMANQFRKDYVSGNPDIVCTSIRSNTDAIFRGRSIPSNITIVFDECGYDKVSYSDKLEIAKELFPAVFRNKNSVLKFIHIITVGM